MKKLKLSKKKITIYKEKSKEKHLFDFDTTNGFSVVI
jgi:hypothetical protein